MTVELQALPGMAALPPGFRFHPTDEELIVHYLRKRAAAAPCPAAIMAEVDIYKLDPWDLPSRAVFGQPEGNEWYFFSPRHRKYPNGVRPSRSAGSGYWKATGIDKPITAGAGKGGEIVGVKKALVFYQGRPPKGMKTNWTMHEYRLADATRTPMRFNKDSSSMRLDDWVLCRIYKKPSQQLSPLYDPSPLPRSMDASYHSQQDHQHLQVHSSSSSGRMLPRPHSISDYLADYSAVWEFFNTMPPAPDMEGSTGRFFLGSAGDDKASTAWKWQTAMVDSNDDRNGDMSSLAPSKRWLSSDASMTMLNNTYSMFGPDGLDQPSQDRGELQGFAESAATASRRK